MNRLGVVEGFFGPEWDMTARFSWALFLEKWGGDFYIYAPKRDSFLRKNWRQSWPATYLEKLNLLKTTFNKHGIKFGVAISPFGLGADISLSDFKLLDEKFKILSEMGIDYLGLFFDDMPSSENLLKNQSEVVRKAMTFFPEGLIFCPSYYSFDPILDKVFGLRPKGYVEGLASSIPAEVAICWTGPKVISEEISSEHLSEVRNLLGRKPFIWENLYANDGPRNCKFLKLRYFSGRSSDLESQTEAVAFNLMNQPYLSQLLFLSSLKALKGTDPQEAFENSASELCDPKMADFLIKNRTTFLEHGLDQLSSEEKKQLRDELSSLDFPMSIDIQDWLEGKYIVGPECLTD